jgi:hypothetical protein
MPQQMVQQQAVLVQGKLMPALEQMLHREVLVSMQLREQEVPKQLLQLVQIREVLKLHQMLQLPSQILAAMQDENSDRI